MKRIVTLCLALSVSGILYGQLTGIKSIPGDFSSIEAAIAALNSQGVGTGGVIFNIEAGHNETFTFPTAGLINTNTGTSDNPILFQKSGDGANPVITAATPGTGNMDYIICFSGTDFVTFDGISIQENPANTNSTMQVEWAFAILKESETNGSQHLTIKNCSISLNSSNPGSYAIYSNNHTIASTNQLLITNITGTNSYNKFYGLSISNTYNAFYLYGRQDSSPYSFYDQDNEVGVTSANIVTGLGYTGSATVSYGLYSYHQNGIKIANNAFTGNCNNTAGSLYVTYLNTAYNADIEIYNNTISMTYLGTGSFYALYANGFGRSGTTNTVSIYNNHVINNQIPNFTTGFVYFTYIITGGVTANFYGNEVSGNTVGSSSAGATGYIYYSYFNSTPTNAGTINVYDNIVNDNVRIQSSLGIGNTYLFYIGGSGNVLNEYNNEISDITIAASGSTYGIYNIFSGSVKNIYNNTLHQIADINGTIYSLYNQGGSAGNIYNNKIWDINAESQNAIIYGFYHASGTNQYYYNNYISELYSPLATGNPAIYAMYFTGANPVGAFNNTIYLDASSSSSTFGVTGIWASTTPNIELRNNIVVNNSVPGATGKIIAYQRSGTTLTTYSSSSDNNAFYAGTPGELNLIYYDGTHSDQTINTYKVRVSPRDIFSISENPSFVNIASHPYDLHIQAGTSNQCESQGRTVISPVNIVEDFDGDPRYPNAGYPEDLSSPASAPDIGADEFGGIFLDQAPPMISFSPLASTSELGSRTLTTNITDLSGVPDNGSGLPVLYWKINAGPWTGVTAEWLGGNTYNFTFGDGVVTGDMVSYYIVAQDNVTPAPNVISNPSVGADGYTFHPPAAMTPPTSPYFYSIGLGGDITVGTGGDYPSLTGPSGLFASMNATVVSGNITATIISDLTETGANALNQFTEDPIGSNFTLTIQPDSPIVRSISGSFTGGLVRLNGADRVIIDGRYAGSGNYLSISNTATGGTIAAIQLISLGNDAGASNNTIRNCNIKTGSNASGTYGIVSGGSTIATIGADNDDNIFQNNTISKVYTGIWSQGSATTNPGLMDDIQILENTIGSTDPSHYIGHDGIIVGNGTGGIIEQNTVYNIITLANTPVGVTLFTGFVSATISRNNINNITYSGTGGYGGRGMYVNTGNAASNLSINNNLIYQIGGDGSTTFSNSSMVGMFFDGTTGGLNVYYNSIYMSGNFARNASTLTAAILFNTTSVTSINLRDNIFQNSMNNTSVTTDKNYAIYSSTPNTSFTNINYNDYYVTGSQGVLGFLGGDRTTITAWRTATGKDLNSISSNPLFAGPSNLKIYNGSPVLAAGTAIAGIDFDFLNADRSNTNPTMGAYETALSPLAGTFSIPGNFISIQDAIVAINAQGVGSGGAVFNIAAGHAETFTTLTAGKITTTTGSVSNPIIFQKSGAGPNPRITAPLNGTGSVDYIICVAGTDYLTFDGIDVQENSGNTSTTTQAEWAFAILKASATNGSQYVTIKNCNISLNKTNTNTYGIYSDNFTPSAPFSQLTVTATSGANSYNKFYNNLISNVYRGIYLSGYADPSVPYQFYDQGNDIGSEYGNMMMDFAGGTSFSYIISIYYQNNLIVANNNINGGDGTSADLGGIVCGISNNSSGSIYNNTIQLTRIGTSESLRGIYNSGYGTAGTNNTLNIYNNTVQNCTFPNGTTSYFFGIYNGASAFNSNFYGNTVSGNVIGGSYTMYLSYTNSAAGGTANIYDNIISNNQRTGLGTQSGHTNMYCLYVPGSASNSIHDNHIFGNSIGPVGPTYGGTIYSLFCSNSSPNQNIFNNIIHDQTITSTYTSSNIIYGIYSAPNSDSQGGIYNNSIYNLTITLNSAGFGVLFGLSSNGLSSIYGNTIHNLNVTNESTGYGYGTGYYLSGSTSSNNFYNNEIYGVSMAGTSGNFSGIRVNSGATMNLYNNFISDIKTPASNSSNAINGIYISGGTNVNLYYNTIYLDATSSSSSTYNTNGIFAVTTPNIELRNNIVINKSTAPASTTYIAAAYRRNSTDLSTYSAASNNNLFFTGTPSANNVIFTDGTNTDQTLGIFKSRVYPRDAFSVSEDPPFVNATTPPYDLHLQSGVATLCESRGSVVSSPVSIIADFDSEPRYPNTGYPDDELSPATAPDIGADEFDGIYQVIQGLSGEYTVGTDGDYPSLTGPGGLFADINSKTVTGNITATIISDLTETGAHALNQMADEPFGSNFTLTIKPDAAMIKAISGAYSGGLIRLNGADRINFDGRYNGNGNYLAFENTALSGTIAVFQLISQGANAGASNNTIRNCNIKAGHKNSGSYGIVSGGASIASNGYDNDNNTFLNNNISKAYVGIWASGSSSANPGLMDNLQITGNSIGADVAADYIGHDGIMVAYGSGGAISRNMIYNIMTTAYTPVGISLSTGFVSANISQNNIKNIAYTGTYGYGGRGMYINTGSAASDLSINNNLIYAIGGDGYPDFSFSSPVGMYFDGSMGGLNINYNSVFMSGYCTYNSDTKTAAILFYTSTINNVTLQNNIFQNSMENEMVSLDKNYAIYSNAPNSSFTSINHNDYYVTGYQGILGYLGFDLSTLADWQSATGQDANSISADPLFTATDDLRVSLISPVIGAGTPITGIDNDYENSDRSDTNPSIGAYETGYDLAGPSIAYTLLENTESTSNRALTDVIIMDLSGVNTSGNSPRIYFKRSGDANEYNDNTNETPGWKWTETLSSVSPFSFTIDYSLLFGGNGLAGGQQIQYFVVAQDAQATPLVSINSGEFAALPASVALTGSAFPIGGMINNYYVLLPLSGTKTIPGDFGTIEEAISALNLLGAGSGGVTFDVATGHQETFSSPDAGLITTTATSLLSPVIFQKAGAGVNPLVTAPLNGIGSADYIICCAGTDYITFDGIDVQENQGNTNITTQAEWAYAILKASATNGSQHVTIKNCNISLAGTNYNTYGIYSDNVTPANPGYQLTITEAGGTNSYNKFYGNTISSTNGGIYLYGYNDPIEPYTFYDQGNDVGSEAGNILTNFGGSDFSIGFDITAQNELTVANNNISGGENNTSGIFGIRSGTSYHASASFYGNTISLTSSGTSPYIFCMFNNGFTGGKLNIYDNIIQNCSNPNAISTSFYGIYNDGLADTINIFSNSVTNNEFIGDAYLYLLNSTSATDGVLNVYDNMISDNNHSGSGAYMECMNLNGTGEIKVHNNNIYSNSIESFSAYSSITSIRVNNWALSGSQAIFNNVIHDQIITGSGYTSYYNIGIESYAEASPISIYNNSIYNLALSNSSPAYGFGYGINCGGGTEVNIYRNEIYGIDMNFTDGYYYAVYLGSGDIVNICNNYITDINTPAVTYDPGLTGIYIGGGTDVYLHYNTIYLNCANTSTSYFGSAGIYASTTPNIELRNNLIINTSAANSTTYSTVAYRRENPVISSYSTASNNNCFFAGTPGPNNLIFSDGTTSVQTLPDYKELVSPAESYSVTEFPPFVNVTTAPYDLHLLTTVPTQCESGGAAVSTPGNITTDFDGNPRYPAEGYPENGSYQATAPDIGADEFGGISVDFMPPYIAFTPLLNTTSTEARLLTASITDANGVPTTGTGLPVLYWKINDDSWNSYAADWVSGNNYAFSFGSGVVLGDVVSYYIVAQDTVAPASNVGSSPSGGAGGFTANPPACSIPPISPCSYAIVVNVNGDFTVGEGGNYSSLTGAGGLFDDLNNKVINGNITATIVSDLAETGAVALNPLNADPAGSEFTLTIQPDGTTARTISGWYDGGGLIRLKGADRVTIDGRNAGSGNFLSIINTSTNYNIAAVQLISLGSDAGSSHNVIRNCNISTGSNYYGTYGIIIGGSIIPASGADNDYNIIRNNKISKAYTGIWAQGTRSSNPGLMDNLQILENTIGADSESDYIGWCGINVGFGSGGTISQNTIYNIITPYSYPVGITLSSGFVSAEISRNKIKNLGYTGAYYNDARGMYIDTRNPSSNLSIYNNLICNIGNFGNNSPEYSVFYGMYIVGITGGMDIGFNTVYLSGNPSSYYGTYSYAIMFGSSSITDVDLQNNIIMNSIDDITNSYEENYAVYSAAPVTAFSHIDYNDYIVTGLHGILGYLGSYRTTLSDWQTATGQDEHSQNLDPIFLSLNDLHPTNIELDNKGLYQESVTIDFSGTDRSDPPDIGAYEFDGDLIFRLKENISGRTYYDLQSNNALSNRIALHPDGTIGMVWTHGIDFPVFPDRGTGYNFFDGTSWNQEPTTRIETMQCGWPSYDTWGENGEIIVSHDGTSGLQINTRQNRGSGTWEGSAFHGPSGLMVQWPRLVTSGEDHDWIHLICNSNGSYEGQQQAMLYSRSNNGGVSWNPQNIILPGTGAEFYTSIEEDEYTMAARGNTIAILVSSAWKDLFILKSIDNGSTWTKTVIWQHPYPMFDFNTTSTSFFYCVDNSGSLAIGPDNMVHVVFGISQVLHYWPGNYYDVWPEDGIGYWNETMEPFSNDLNALSPPSKGLPTSEMIRDYNYIGWSQDMNGDGEITFISQNGRPWIYRSKGTSTMPSIAVDSSNNVFVVYASTTETYDNGSYDFKKIWMRAYDNWKWGDFYHVTADSSHDEEESVYPVISLNSDDNIHLFYQADATPGIAVDGAHAYQENRIMYARVPKNNLLSLYTWTGAQDTTWNKSGNWTRNLIPGGTASIIIPGIPPNQPVLNNNAICKKLTLQNGSELIVNKDKQLVITDSLIIEQDNPADPTLLTIKGEIRIEAGKAPGAPINPSPADGARIQYWDMVLSWTCSDPDGDPLTFDVYFDTLPDPTILIASNLSSPYFAYADSLLPAEYYYWKVIAHDNRTRSTEGPVWSFSTINAIQPCPGMPVITYEGRDYHTVQIAGQCWMQENLDVGMKIEGGSGPSDNEVIEKYCYNNDTAYCNEYGGLYTWDEMMQYVDTADAQGICPSGWHIPSAGDWNLLIAYLGGNNVAGLKLKESGITHWEYPNTGATNESGFTALPAGITGAGTFNYLTTLGFIWSSNEVEDYPNVAWNLNLQSNHPEVALDYSNKMSGMPARCLNDVVINQAPAAPSTPNPLDNSTNQQLIITLSWVCTDLENDPLTFDIYFDTVPEPVVILASDTTAYTYFIADTLQPLTTYYWKVVAHDIEGNTTIGDTWQFTTGTGWQCGNSLMISHIAGTVAPVDKNTTYGTVTNIPGEPSKCWITSNLGADHQATAINDVTEASRGWYWQFNRAQGYKHDGSTLTPNWTITSINENSEWQPASDPCTLELGNGWRVPTNVEWTNVVLEGGWNSGNSPWNSALKIHYAGSLWGSDGSPFSWGTFGYYWSSSQLDNSSGMYLSVYYGGSMYYNDKAFGFSIRCLSESSSTIPAAPSPGTHVPSATQIIWNWTTVAGATGYKWNTTDDYGTAEDMATGTSKTETGLASSTSYTRYAWAYNALGHSAPVTLTASTTGVWLACGDPLSINHIAGAVAPVNKSVTYGTVTNIPGETSKCWITSNLGADHQATAVDDATEASAGWYWQFNRMQGYKHDGTTRTPNTTWISDINENSDWIASNDPCNLELGNSWRLPTNTEWTNLDASGGWTNWNDPWNSALKMHAAGYLHYVNGTLYEKGSRGYYWSSSQMGNSDGWSFDFYSDYCYVLGQLKAFGFSARCICEPAPAVPAAPSPGTHVPSETQIIWNWTSVAGATGYKWNTTNDYTGALNTGTNTFITETSLTCGTNYSRYAWAYNAAGHSEPVTLTVSTLSCGFTCGNSLAINHVAGVVAPVNKSVTYGTVTNIPGEIYKCWITSNLGADHQATAVNDATEASAGWYWQFNRMQGYKHDGSTRTPNSAWIGWIEENSDWITANDPCAIELGTGWRIPTSTEWTNVDAAGNWSNSSGPWNSALKLHEAGSLNYSNGSLGYRGTNGVYYSSTQGDNTWQGRYLFFESTWSNMSQDAKANARSVRCLRD